MERLTTRQIADFNNPLAFARDRAQRVGQIQLGRSTSNVIRTNDIEQSFRLVSGALQRLDTLKTNLQTMQRLTDDAIRARRIGNNRQLEEAYGKMRSLSAGFDQVVDAVRFRGETVFSGNNLMLNLGPGAKPLQLEAAKLFTFGENSLNLSSAEASADVSVSYRTEDIIFNRSFEVVGIDIEEASFIRGSNPALELEDGQYKVAITYAGANSTVALTRTDGSLIESKSSIDLSGAGRRWVDFDNGVRLTFKLESFLQSVDKFDFENRGPAELRATLNYRRIEKHTLRTSEAPGPDEVRFIQNTDLLRNGGRLSVDKPFLSPVTPPRAPLASGSYTLEIDYFGENSVVKVRDNLGRIQSYLFGVDLTGSEPRRVDLGIGFSVDITNDQFSANGSRLSLPLQYQRERPPLEDFDFRSYQKRIADAIEVVQEQMELFEKAAQDIERFNELRNSAAMAGVPNRGAFLGGNALSLLTGGGEGSIFKPASTQARLTAISNQLFSATTAFPTQANMSAQELLSTRKAAANDWLSTFT